MFAGQEWRNHTERQSALGRRRGRGLPPEQQGHCTQAVAAGFLIGQADNIAGLFGRFPMVIQLNLAAQENVLVEGL
jgi:hypothetical protein